MATTVSAVASPLQPTITYVGAARFLQQASWGPTPALISHVQAVGYPAYIDEQLASTEDPFVTDSNFQMTAANLWSISATHEQSQLRTKMAWAWYKLFNPPGSTVNSMMGAVPEVLNRDAFANFNTILSDISLNIEMGMFLNYCCSDTTSAAPDENFAREVMQIFTLGPNQLNDDGTPVTATDGSTVPAYTMDDVRAIARSVTGLTYTQDVWNNNDYEGTVSMTSGYAGWHDNGSKQLIGTSIPAGLDARTEVLLVDSILAASPNTGRHLSSYLIHELVTSNPSPAYVKRVASVWQDDGTGLQGNIAAVVKAILLDPEARINDDPSVGVPDNFGRLRDHVNFATTIIREFGAAPVTQVPLWGALNDFGHLGHEGAWDAQTVFGYYSDEYGLPGTGLLAPEAQLYTTDSIIARARIVAYVFGLPGVQNPVASSVNWTSWAALAGGDGQALINQLNQLCFHGSMSTGLSNLLSQKIQSLPSSDLTARAQETAYLAVMSPEFAVER